MITCEKCGAVLEDGMRFCITCGNKLASDEATSVQPVEEAAAPIEAVAPVAAKETVSEAVTEIKPEEISYVDAEPFTPPEQPETYTDVSPTPAESRIPVMPSEQTAPVFSAAPVAAPQEIYGTRAVAETKNSDKAEPVIGIGGWIGTFVLMCIPLVNLIMIIIWACGKSKYKSKVNFARAGLILFLIVAILSVAALIVLLLAFRNEFDYVISWFTESLSRFNL